MTHLRTIALGLLALLSFAVQLGCGPSLPKPYLEARAAAQRAYAHGRYDEAAAHWRKAMQRAERSKDQADAMYRRAVSLRRAGRVRQARSALSLLITKYPKSHRVDRAAYDLADMSIEAGDTQLGFQRMADFVRERPTSGLAMHAAERYMLHLENRDGAASAAKWADAMQHKTRGHAVEEFLGYRVARLKQQEGELAASLGGYLSVARRFPYPHGAYWDDALFRAAGIERQLGRPGQALKHLGRLLKERESADLQGSYEKPIYAQARLERAAILEAMGSMDAALTEFRRVFNDHKHSLLRDDALWRESLLAMRLGREERACDAARLLVKELPDSRYAACTRLVCPNAPKAPRSCRAYIRREVRELQSSSAKSSSRSPSISSESPSSASSSSSSSSSSSF